MVWVENLIGNFDGLKNRSMFDGTAAYPTRLRVRCATRKIQTCPKLHRNGAKGEVDESKSA